MLWVIVHKVKQPLGGGGDDVLSTFNYFWDNDKR